MNISEKYLQLGKEQMICEKELTPASSWDIEVASTQTAQDISNHLKEEEMLQLLQERPEFITKEARWGEVEAEYFTVYWVLVRLLCDWLEDELEQWGKAHLTSEA